MFNTIVWYITTEDTIDFTNAVSPTHLARLLEQPNTSQDITIVADKLLNGKD